MNFSALLLGIVYSVLESIGLGSIDWVFLLVLVIIGLIVILLVKLFLVFIPAILAAIVVYFLTGGDLFWAGVAFLVVALLSLLSKL
jgi:hypothetical protein